jgi:hypothetical protein
MKNKIKLRVKDEKCSGESHVYIRDRTKQCVGRGEKGGKGKVEEIKKHGKSSGCKQGKTAKSKAIK